MRNRYPSEKDIAAILELHLRDSLKQADSIMMESWIAQMMPNILDAFVFAHSSQSSLTWTLKDLISWAICLRYYPMPENEADITRYLLDIGHRLFRTRYYFNFNNLIFIKIFLLITNEVKYYIVDNA